jgi:hypothetical protein
VTLGKILTASVLGRNYNEHIEKQCVDGKCKKIEIYIIKG